ncbi:hypothetical protein [Candidatus Methylacidiphilum infernorum]|uniref:hypothetical protein n=1 Tax=Candidatus Methylacidiphilum infernorum TaxID=511746 RepID=UPI000662AC77|nr:hypothetical protein [Candidatus Methylacidiphilum infernorum]
MKLYNGLLGACHGLGCWGCQPFCAHRPFPHHHYTAASLLKEKCWVQSKELAGSKNSLQSEAMSGSPSRAKKNGCQKGFILVASLRQTGSLLLKQEQSPVPASLRRVQPARAPLAGAFLSRRPAFRKELAVGPFREANRR